jgi:hypothetical protein
MERRDAVLALVDWRGALNDLRASLQNFPWDCEHALVILRPDHICRAIERFLKDEVSAMDLEEWAEAVEGREDVGYFESQSEIISEALFQLSTPAANVPISKQIAGSWLHELSSL